MTVHSLPMMHCAPVIPADGLIEKLVLLDLGNVLENFLYGGWVDARPQVAPEVVVNHWLNVCLKHLHGERELTGVRQPTVQSRQRPSREIGLNLRNLRGR